MPRNKEVAACSPMPLQADAFNRQAQLPYGLTTDHVCRAMQDFLDFLGFVNGQLNTKQIERLESFLMPAGFSSMVGEFIATALPKYCHALVRNKRHNGHPDILPKGQFPGDSALHATQGIEVKGSRHKSGWQGHNPEEVWLMVCVFDSNTSRDAALEIEPRPFQFIKIVGAQLTREDWSYSGRSETSRRTITASVTRSGAAKLEANWIYRASSG